MEVAFSDSSTQRAGVISALMTIKKQQTVNIHLTSVFILAHRLAMTLRSNSTPTLYLRLKLTLIARLAKRAFGTMKRRISPLITGSDI